MYLLQASSISILGQVWKLIEALDQRLFLYVNGVWTNSFLDNIFPIYRESTTWIPLYLFLLLLVVINFKWKAVPWIIIFIATVGICDQVSSSVIKDLFARIRPCRDPAMAGYVRLLISNCPGSGSFTSSHATNHFGMVAFMIITLKPYVKKAKWALWFWAATIAYGQVYIGVHYPLDVIGGGILGVIIGYTTGYLFNKNFDPLVIAENIGMKTNSKRM